VNFLRRLILAITSGRLIQSLARRLLLTSSRILPISFEFLVEAACLERPAHAYCMWHAAKLAQKLGYKEISVAEFGVAGGATLLIISRYAIMIEKETRVCIRVYGFDTGGGLPELEGVRDLPYWFRPAQYSMDVEKLRHKLKNTELVLGNVRNTVGKFFEDSTRPPLAVIFNDLDFYSSTRDALRIFDADFSHFLPRLFMYLDDVIGTPEAMYGPFNGQLLANADYNSNHNDIKIHLNQNLLPLSHISWRHQIYYVHLFNHPKYSEYIGGSEQDMIEANLQLRN
jgi:hypothetical protein